MQRNIFHLAVLSEAKNTAAFAISSGSAKRPSGICFFAFSFTSSESTSVISVFTNPGAMALQVIPLDANSFAADLVNPIIPALEAQ